jgi:hypothetical protein
MMNRFLILLSIWELRRCRQGGHINMLAQLSTEELAMYVSSGGQHMGGQAMVGRCSLTLPNPS